MTLPFVVVEWNDAWKSATDDVTLEQAGDAHQPVRCFSAGWLLRDDDTGVQVASERSPGEKNYRQRTFIPRAMVVAVTHHALAKPRKKKHVETRE